ncbi:MAG: TonB family protein [Thermodesulfovibrionia bacterium]|nr:TonB family protein [Thermodesulfovibrionia bacterium]
MRQSRSIGREPHFSRIVFVSVIAHLLFISLVVIPLRTKEQYRTYHVTLIGSLRTPRISKVPSIKKKIKRKITKKSVKSPVKTMKAPPKTDMSIENVSKEIERIRAISALSKKREKSRTKLREIEIGKEKAPDMPAGGVGIPGTGTGDDTDYYYSIVSQKIWQHWFYAHSRSSGLEVIISIRIDKDGEVISQEIEKFSGDVLFDRSAIKAISKASPFPPPPEELEIGVRFYL